MKKFLILTIMFFCFVGTSVFAADLKSFLDKIETLKKQGISYNATTNLLMYNKTIDSKFYIKGNKIRIDAPEGSTIIDDKNIYVYLEKEKKAMKMNANGNVEQSVFAAIQDKADELKFVGKGSKNGYSCHIFKSKDASKDIIFYLTDDYGFPTYMKEENAESNITNFKVGKISDNIFVLPKDINVIDMSNFSMEDMQ